MCLFQRHLCLFVESGTGGSFMSNNRNFTSILEICYHLQTITDAPSFEIKNILVHLTLKEITITCQRCCHVAGQCHRLLQWRRIVSLPLHQLLQSRRQRQGCWRHALMFLAVALEWGQDRKLTHNFTVNVQRWTANFVRVVNLFLVTLPGISNVIVFNYITSQSTQMSKAGPNNVVFLRVSKFNNIRFEFANLFNKCGIKT